VFFCEESSECEEAGVVGVCQPGGLCSFPDGDCDSGQRYGELAGNASGECVSVDDATGSGAATSAASASATSGGGEESSDGGAGSTTINVSGGSSTGEPPPATDDGPLETTSDGGESSSSGGGTTTGDPYGPCQEDEDCRNGDCIESPGLNGGVCMPLCEEGAQCPPHPSGARAICDDTMPGDAHCVLPCDEQNAQCPAGFECVINQMTMMGTCVPT
jgi:hypothetical protein